MLEIDGSLGEGGGQAVRTALSLSAVSKTPVKIYNIRAKRDNPGLSHQHLAAARAVRSISRGTLSGCEYGSSELEFNPGPIVGGKYDFDIGTAGSVTLVAQAILPVLASASRPSVIRIRGGTHVIKSPTYDYFEKVFIPAASLFGLKASCSIVRSGYYPAGGGEIELNVEPSAFIGNSSWLRESAIRALIRVSSLPVGIAVREKKIFVQAGLDRVPIFEEDFGAGNAVIAWCGFIGSCVAGEKGKRAEAVAQECMSFLKSEMAAGAEVDSHCADQLLIYAALAAGRSEFKTSHATMHTETCMSVISHFTGRKIAFADGRISVE
jgi:RNA 3'-terminal phosphate cyclase (ATP)